MATGRRPSTLPDEFHFDAFAEHRCARPSLADLVKAAKKEFPNIPFEQIYIHARGTTRGKEGHLIVLKPFKSS